MNTKIMGIAFQKKDFQWVAIFTGVILLIPLIAMQFTDEVNWDIVDFIVMACLLFGIGSLFVLVSRRAQRKHLTPIAIAFIILALYIWTELAVGIFTSLGS